MAVNVNNAFIGTPPIDGGVFFRAPQGTKLPEKAGDTLDPAFKDHGAVGQDGFSVSPERSSTDIQMFGGDVFATAQESYTENITLTLLEDGNTEVLKTVFGDANVEETEATESEGKKVKVYHTADTLPISSIVVKAVSGAKLKTYVAERAQVTSVSEVTTVHNNVTSYQLTLRAFKGSKPEWNYANVVELRDDGVPKAKASEEERGEES